MDIQSIIVFIIFTICIGFAIWWFVKQIKKKGDNGCGCACPGCASIKKDIKSCNSCQGSKNKRSCC